jgi:galactose mutarotase-like enzyme
MAKNVDSYVIENEYLRLTVRALGAEIVSLIDLATGQEIMWQADPTVWAGSAPILFPYVGNLKEGRFTYQGKEYAGLARHGFTRRSVFVLEKISEKKEAVTLRLESNAETRAQYPFEFSVLVSYTLVGNSVQQKVEIVNRGAEEMRFGFGFHPAFALPFAETKERPTADYRLEFDRAQPELTVVEKNVGGEADGLSNGKFSPYVLEDGKTLTLCDDLFERDSVCFTKFAPGTRQIKLIEAATPGKSGRYIAVNIGGFPYVAIWSVLTEKMRFVCIEPWYTVADSAASDGELTHKSWLKLAAGETWVARLSFEIFL